MQIRALFILLACPALASCDDVLWGTDNSLCRDTELTWENYGRSFMKENCTGCHSSLHKTDEDRVGAPVGVDFDTYAGVVANVEGIRLRSVLSSTMPPSTVLDALERSDLSEWLHCEVERDAGF